MGREIRMVPPNWEHPKVMLHGRLCDQPMHQQSFEEACAEWDEDKAEWDAGTHDSLKYYSDGEKPDYTEYAGDRPDDPAWYEPWKDEEATWFQVWQTVSEGTPVTPPFATKEELVEWLSTKGENHGTGYEKVWSRAAAENFVNNEGWAPSLIMTGGEIMPGYEAMAQMPKKQ